MAQEDVTIGELSIIPDRCPFTEQLRCPACHSGPVKIDLTGAICGNCDRHYDMFGGISDFLGPVAAEPSLSQRLMEARLYAAAYERLARPLLTRSVTRRPLIEEFRLAAKLLMLKPDHRVLDVACGTGNFTRRFVRHLGEKGYAVGIDRSRAMLRRAELRRQKEDLENLRFVRADALHLPFKDGAFDRTHCAGAIHLMSDVRSALNELRRVIKPGGLLVLGTFVAGDSSNRMSLLRRFGERVGFHWFRPGELEERLLEAGFALDWSSTHEAALLMRAVAR